MGSYWNESVGVVRDRALALLNLSVALPDRADADAVVKALVSQEFELVHQICGGSRHSNSHDIADLTMIIGRPFESWEADSVNVMLPMLHFECNFFGYCSSPKLDARMRVSLPNLLQYLELWTPKEFGRLGQSAMQALQHMEPLAEVDEYDRHLVLPKLRTLLAKLAAGASSYREDLTSESIYGILSKLERAVDNQDATQALFQIAGHCERSDGRAAFIKAGLAKFVVDFSLKYASCIAEFAPREIPPALLIGGRTTETPVITNGLRKVLIGIGGSNSGLQAFAEAGMMTALASLMEASANMNIFEEVKMGLASTQCGQMEDWRSACMMFACALFPFIKSDATMAIVRILEAVDRQLASISEECFTHKELSSFKLSLIHQQQMCEAGTKACKKSASTVSGKAMQGLKSLRSELGKSCAGPGCDAVENGVKFQLCSGCKAVAYCSRACQKAHWNEEHKHKCSGGKGQVVKPKDRRSQKTSSAEANPHPNLLGTAHMRAEYEEYVRSMNDKDAIEASVAWLVFFQWALEGCPLERLESLLSETITTKAAFNMRMYRVDDQLEKLGITVPPDPSPLALACVVGVKEVVELLLKHSADPGYTSGCGFSPLHAMFASRSRDHKVGTAAKADYAITATLLDSGLSPNCRDMMSDSPLLVHAAAYTTPEILTLMLEKRADLNARSGSQEATALHTAAHSGNLKALRALVEHSADVNSVNGFGETPLEVAVTLRHADCTRFLAGLVTRPSESAQVLKASKPNRSSKTKSKRR